jgi:Phosphotransferase enzyme family
MYTRPPEPTDAQVVDAVRAGWGLSVTDISYSAVGFGSHHWHATADGRRWFVTVDDLVTSRREASDTTSDAAERLTAALGAACSLRDSGLDFVIAPRQTIDGDIVQRIDDRFLAALYDHVDGVSHEWGPYPGHAERLAVLDRILTIHAADHTTSGAIVDDFAIPQRDHLHLALCDTDTPWGPGPYADDARALLRLHHAAVRHVLARYDRMAIDVARRPERLVLTHGEPHPGNTIDTASGVVLIDWDTALLAPPERDLWALIGEDEQIADEYTRRTGVAIERTAVELYRLWWDLCEVSLYVAQFRAPHSDTDDSRVSWGSLQTHLDPSRWTGV